MVLGAAATAVVVATVVVGLVAVMVVVMAVVMTGGGSRCTFTPRRLRHRRGSVVVQ